MLFFELYKIMVKEVTFVGFRGCDRPSPGSAPAFNCKAASEVGSPIRRWATENRSVRQWRSDERRTCSHQ